MPVPPVLLTQWVICLIWQRCIGPVSTNLAEIVMLHKLLQACVSYIREGLLWGKSATLWCEGRSLWCPKGHAITSSIYLFKGLDINPNWNRIKTAVGDISRFHLGLDPWKKNAVPWCILGLCGLTPTLLLWNNVIPICCCLISNMSLSLLTKFIIVLWRMYRVIS